MNNNHKKVIISGANGFIGSWLCKEYSDQGYEVYAIVRNRQADVSGIELLPKLKIIYCDLSNIDNLPNLIEVKDFDAFIHLAWNGAGGKKRADYTIQINNIKYTCDTILAAKKLGCKKIVFSGTISEMFANNLLENEYESENLLYAVAKNTTHKFIDTICKQINIDYMWIRFANIYGPESKNGNIVEYAIRKILNGDYAEFSSGTQPYDLLYVKDLVRGIVKLTTIRKHKKIYYIGSGNGNSLKDYLFKIGDIMEAKDKIRLGYKSDDGLVYQNDWFEISNFINDTNFKFEYTFEDGIRETIDWIRRDENNAI